MYNTIILNNFLIFFKKTLISFILMYNLYVDIKKNIIIVYLFKICLPIININDFFIINCFIFLLCFIPIYFYNYNSCSHFLLSNIFIYKISLLIFSLFYNLFNLLNILVKKVNNLHFLENIKLPWKPIFKKYSYFGYLMIISNKKLKGINQLKF